MRNDFGSIINNMALGFIGKSKINEESQEHEKIEIYSDNLV